MSCIKAALEGVTEGRPHALLGPVQVARLPPELSLWSEGLLDIVCGQRRAVRISVPMRSRRNIPLSLPPEGWGCRLPENRHCGRRREDLHRLTVLPVPLCSYKQSPFNWAHSHFNHFEIKHHFPHFLLLSCLLFSSQT